MAKSLMILIAILGLTGCVYREVQIKNDTYMKIEDSQTYLVYCDSEYGVEYISTTRGIAARISRDGTPVTCRMDGE